MSIIYDSVLHRLRERDVVQVQGAYIAKGNVNDYDDLTSMASDSHFGSDQAGWTYHVESGAWAGNEFYWAASGTSGTWECLGPNLIGSGVLTIISGGTSTTFNANQTSDTTIEITGGGGVDTGTVSNMISAALTTSVGNGQIIVSQSGGAVIGSFTMNQSEGSTLMLPSAPVIPTVGSAAITIYQGAVSKGQFNVNATENGNVTLDAPSPVIASGATVTSIAAGDNVTIGMNGGVMTISASGGGTPSPGQSVTWSGSTVSSIAEGSNVSMSMVNGGLLISALQPTLPTVGSATITIYQGATSKGSFNVNAAEDGSVTLDAPEHVVASGSNITSIAAGNNITLGVAGGVMTVSAEAGGGGLVVSGLSVTSMAAGSNVELSVNGSVVTVSEAPEAITEIPAASSAYALSDGRFKHAPEAAMTYTLPTVADATKAHEILLDISFASTTSATFVMSDSTPVTPYQQPVISSGAYIRYICEYSPLQSAWGIMPVPLAHSELPSPVVVSGAVVSQIAAGTNVTLGMNSGTLTISASGGGGGGGGITLQQARRQALIFG